MVARAIKDLGVKLKLFVSIIPQSGEMETSSEKRKQCRAMRFKR
jgi:hypothetical protein